MEKKKIKHIDLPKARLPKSTRGHQVHKTAKDYDRSDRSWKNEIPKDT